MAYNENLVGRLRKALSDVPHVKEQEKMGGVSFMVNGKMCVRAHSDGNLMMRCPPENTEELLTKKGASRFVMKGKPMMKGWLVISPEGTDNNKDFNFWVKTAVDYCQS